VKPPFSFLTSIIYLFSLPLTFNYFLPPFVRRALGKMYSLPFSQIPKISGLPYLFLPFPSGHLTDAKGRRSSSLMEKQRFRFFFSHPSTRERKQMRLFPFPQWRFRNPNFLCPSSRPLCWRKRSVSIFSRITRRYRSQFFRTSFFSPFP